MILLTSEWRKATVSGDGLVCVEAREISGTVEVRDSKDPDGPILRYASAEWKAFLDGVKKGEFDLPS